MNATFKLKQFLKIHNFFSQILKLYAWEPSFQSLVGGIRKKEILILKQMGYLAAGTSFIWSCAPFVVSLVSFTSNVSVQGEGFNLPLSISNSS